MVVRVPLEYADGLLVVHEEIYDFLIFEIHKRQLNYLNCLKYV